MQLNERLVELRKKHNISQEKLAEAIGVSRQAVQKWESRLSMPDIDNLISLSKYFDISLDFLITCTEKRTTEELRLDKKITQDYSMAGSWELFSSYLKIEYIQSFDEGKDIEQMESLIDAVIKLKSDHYKEAISDVIFNMILNLPQRENYPYVEPCDLNEIKRLRPKSVTKFEKPENIDRLKKNISGAWMGRICGCLLGKPIEGIRTKELNYLLKKTDNYPMHRYIKFSDLSDEICNFCSHNLRAGAYIDKISAAPTDDDTNYTVLAAMKLIDTYGRDFIPKDVAEVWINSQPKSAYYTAEKVAYKNIINGFCPPNSAVYKNPFREWIGAQIRADYFGYINPGDPEMAAEMAWRDASISHTKNGIYGEMFVAAMLACAAVCKDIKTVILGGLSQIPQSSRLFEQITEIINYYDTNISAEECFSKIHKKYDEYSSYDWCHTISNAAIVVAAMLYGKADFGKSICYAVQAGFDTDCNGATVGSIIGMIVGENSIDENWTTPLNNSLETSIVGIGKVKISELIDLTIKHIHQSNKI